MVTEKPAETLGIILSLLGFFLIFGLELTTYFLTNLLVFLAEAYMGIGEILISSFLLLSVVWSRKPADELYMFGRRRAQNVAALVSAMIIILFMSVETFREAIPKLYQPTTEFQNIDLGLAVILIVIAIAIIPFVNILRAPERGTPMRTQMVGLLIELGSDVATLAGVILVSVGFLWADPSASILVGVSMVLSGVALFKTNVGYLVGRAPNREFFERVDSTARTVEGVLDVDDIRAEYVGEGIVHAGLTIAVARDTSIEDADRIAHEVEAKVSRQTGCQHCVIHIEPAKTKEDLRVQRAP